MPLIMDVVWILLAFNCFWLSFGSSVFNITDENNLKPVENNTFKLELFPPHPTYAGQTRMPRTIFKKLHSGAAFLAGLKLGTILSKKGFELGHGKIASTHSFQVFGKSVNSAMSLSYGNTNSLLPVVDDAPEPEESDHSKKTALKKDEKKFFRVTVIESPSDEALKVSSLQEDDKVQDDVNQSNGDGRINENVAILYQDVEGEEPEEKIRADFLEDHNNRVKEFNESVKRRRNSKF